VTLIEKIVTMQVI